MRRISLLAFLLIIFLTPVLAQKTNLLREKDKAQLVQTILKNYNFRKDSGYWKDNAVNSIYLLAPGTSDEQLPRIKNTKFILITQKQIDQLDKTVADYYKFGEFQVDAKSVRITFSRLYLHPVNGDGTVTWYECRKMGAKWNVKELRTMEFADSPS